MVGAVQITGLREVTRGFKALPAEVEKTYKKELIEIGEEILHDAQARMPVRSARALESMKAGADGKGAFVSGGKKKVPYYGWLDFGSRKPISGRPRSVGPWRGSGKGPVRGRILYPAIDRKMPELEKRAHDAVDKAKRALSL